MNANLSLGAPLIDLQHQELFASLRKLTDSGETQFPDEVLSDVLTQLGAQIRHHFTTEEKLMLAISLPEAMLRQHRDAHSLILEELTQLHLDAMHGKASHLPEIIATVSKWVQQHLIEFDLALKPYIAAHTIQQAASLRG